MRLWTASKAKMARATRCTARTDQLLRTLPTTRRRLSLCTKNCRVPQLSQLLLLLPLSSPLTFRASSAMAKAADKKADKKVKAAAPAKKAVAASSAKAAAKPISFKEILAKAKKQVGVSTRICKASHVHHVQEKKTK